MKTLCVCILNCDLSLCIRFLFAKIFLQVVLPHPPPQRPKLTPQSWYLWLGVCVLGTHNWPCPWVEKQQQRSSPSCCLASPNDQLEYCTEVAGFRRDSVSLPRAMPSQIKPSSHRWQMAGTDIKCQREHIAFSPLTSQQQRPSSDKYLRAHGDIGHHKLGRKRGKKIAFDVCYHW